MIGPYLYEPEAEPKRNGDEPRPEAEGDDDEGRLEQDNLNQWCQCGHCQILETEEDLALRKSSKNTPSSKNATLSHRREFSVLPLLTLQRRRSTENADDS